MEILHSKIVGKGNPLLILHGYFGMSDNWKSLGNKFSKDFEVHLIDQRNHGRSFHAYEFNYDVLVDDLYNYITHHQLENVFLLGHSMGGKVAMLFSVTYPELVEKLVVADIAPKYYPPHHAFILDALNEIDFSKHKSRKQIEAIFSKNISEKGVIQFLLKNVYWKTKDELGFRFNLKSLTENNNEVGEGLSSNMQFYGETLFLKGENSGYITLDDENLIHQHFPEATILTVKNAGHWLHAENSKDFYSYVVSFLQL